MLYTKENAFYKENVVKNIWNILEIDATKDEELIKKAYRTKLMHTNPEDDPEGFKKLREAYEEAVKLIYESDEEVEDDTPKTEVDFWLVKVEEIYKNWKRRIDVNEWKKILEDEVCIALDTSDEASEKLLVFLMQNYNIIYEVWNEINKTFDYLNLKSEIREKFPEGFYNFVCTQISYKTFLDYSELKGDNDAPYDETINNYYSLKRAMDEETESEDLCGIVESIEASGIEHPYFTTDILRYAIKYKSDNIEYINNLISKAEASNENFYVYAYLCEAYMFLEDYEKAGYYINKSRELNSEFINGELIYIKYLMTVGNYSEAKEKSADFLEEHGNHPEGLKYMRESNEIIMRDYKEKADAGDEDALLELGWCMFQNEMFVETIEMLDKYEPDKEHYFDYCNLYGRCAIAGDMYEKALNYLIKWNRLITELVDDGSEKYKKRVRRLAYSYYTIACCGAMLAQKHMYNADYEQRRVMFRMAEDNMKKAIESENDERELYHYKERLAYLYVKNEYPNEAIQICNEIIEREPQYYPAYCVRQMAFFAMKNGQGVIDDFYNSIDIYPLNPEVYEYAIKAFINYEQYSDAKNIIERAKENNVTSLIIETLNTLVDRCIAENTPESVDKAIKELDKLEENMSVYVAEGTSNDSIAEFYYNKMLNYIKTNSYENALFEIKNAMKYNKYPFKYLWYCAELYIRMDKLEEAYNIYNEAILAGREEAEAYYNIGKIMSKLNSKTDEIIKVYEKGLSLEPDHYALNDMLAELYIEKFKRNGNHKYYEIAIEYENKQIEVNPGAYVHVNRGLMYLDNGEFENAIIDFEKAIEFEPNDIYAYNNIAYTYKRQCEYEKAVDVYKKGLELDVDESKEILHRNLYIAYLLLGRYEEAKEQVELMIKEYYGGQAGFDMFGEIFSHSGEFKKCLEAEERFAEYVKDKEECYKSLTETAIHLGDNKLAKKYLKLLKNACDEDKESYYTMLANYYIHFKGDKQKALRYFVKATANARYIQPYINTCRLRYKLGMNPKAEIDELFRIIDSIWYSRESFINYVIDGKRNNFNMALIKFFMGDVEGAMEFMGRMDRFPMCANCHYSKCYERLYLEAIIEGKYGNRTKALELLEEALLINPSDLEVKEEIKDLR